VGREQSRRDRCPRRGSLLLELAITGALLAVAMTLTLRLISGLGNEQRNHDRRDWAVQEAANVMERVTSLPFESIGSETGSPVGLSPEARQVLPGVELHVQTLENGPAGGAGSKRVVVRIRWRNRAGEWDSPVRLTSWIYQKEAPR
jgi:hypothetical protein